MNEWTKETALWHLKAAQRRYDAWKLEVIQNPTDDFKRHLLNNAEKNLTHYIQIYQAV